MLVAPAGLDATIDPDLPVVLEDDARRHAPPPEALRQRVYYVDRHFHRWFSAPRLVFRPGRFALLPYISLPVLPADHVSLRGGPAPRAGERFVLFDHTGRRAVVEATGGTCPPGQQDCIVCAAGDPLRRHWARVLGESVDLTGYSFALGPFTAGEALPAPRALQDELVARGRWRIEPVADLDGDGEADLAWARQECRQSSECVSAETWRLFQGRWYAEPTEPRPSEASMHLLRPNLSTWQGRTHWVTFADQPGSGKELRSSEFDVRRPHPGDYQIISRDGVLGRVRIHPAYRREWWGSYEGFLLDDPPRLRSEHVLLAGPVTAVTAVRAVKMPRKPAYTRAWDPNRPAVEVEVELTDGRRWIVTSRPCAQVTSDGTDFGLCFETHLDREDGPPHRHMTAFFNVGHGLQVDVCNDLAADSAIPEKEA